MLKSILTRFVCVVFEDKCVKAKKDTPSSSATKKCSPETSFWRYKTYADTLRF